MSAKNLDKHNRWRNKTVAFRVSPERLKQLKHFAIGISNNSNYPEYLSVVIVLSCNDNNNRKSI